MPAEPLALDPACGSRMCWYDKADPRAVFGDIRNETITVTDRSHGRQDGTRSIHIGGNVMDFRALPFDDGSFRLVLFDPPHLTRAGNGWQKAKYGVLGDDWRDDLRLGFAECWRVLKPGGTLVFKWSEVQVRLSEVLKLAPAKPLFGHATTKNLLTHWCVFLKPEGQP